MKRFLTLALVGLTAFGSCGLSYAQNAAQPTPVLPATSQQPPANSQEQPVEKLLLPSPTVVPQPQQTPNMNVPGVVPQASTRNKRDDAFEKALKETLPMNNDQIGNFRKQLDGTRKSIATPLSPGKPVTRSLRLTLKPGEEAPVLRLQVGVVSTLTFSDMTGQPWPVLSVVTGNPNAYVAQSAGPEGQSNIIVVSAIQEWVPSNMAVTLLNYPVPVSIVLDQNKPETDYRVDMAISARGPNASANYVGTSSLAPVDDSNMMSFLDGTPPTGSTPLHASQADIDAWRYGNKVYVRTRGDVLSPAYSARSSNVSGFNVFVFNDTPVLLVSLGGQMTRVRLNR